MSHETINFVGSDFEHWRVGREPDWKQLWAVSGKIENIIVRRWAVYREIRNGRY